MKNKIKTMKSRQELKDEEIHQYMNFDKLLIEKEKFQVRQKNLRLLRNGSMGVAAITIAVVLVSFFIDREAEKTEVPPVAKEYAQENVNPKPLPDTNPEEKTNVAGNNEDENENKGIEKRLPENQQRPAAKKEITPKQESVNPPENVYVQAEPLNGYPDLYGYFDRELTYPQEAVRDSIQGVVTVVFSIDPQGKAQHIQIENSLGKAFDREVFKVLENMPPWKPASYNGKHVNSKVSIPLTFQVKKVDTNN